MTTILLVKCKDSILLCGDSQVTEAGISPMPEGYKKIFKVSNQVVCGGAGSCGYIQQNIKEAVRVIKIQKIISDSTNDPEISIDDLSKELAERNFFLPLENKLYQSSSFLLIGVDSSFNLKGVSVGSDGAVFPISSFYSEGSGAESSRAILESSYKKSLSKEELFALAIRALRVSSKIDLFTNKSYNFAVFIKKGNELLFKEMAFEDSGKIKPEKIAKDFFTGEK